MKNNYIQDHRNNQEAYQKFINKISQITKYDKSNMNQQNRSTTGSNAIQYKSEIYKNQINPSNNQTNDIKERQRMIYEKMNQHLSNRRRNADWGQNQNDITIINDNGKKYININNQEQNNEFDDNKGTGHFYAGDNNSSNNFQYQYQYQNQNINQKNDNNFYQAHQHQAINVANNNAYNPFKTNVDNIDNFQANPSVYYQYQNDNVNSYKNNQFPKNIPENSKNNFENNQKQNENILYLNEVESQGGSKKSVICSSLLYGLIFGSFGTLLLWCKNPRVREYLKYCYQNINTESIMNFFKMFLHPIDLIQKIRTNIGSLSEILIESMRYLYEFIEEYSDLWRLLGIIVMVYVLWIIIKKIFRLFAKSEKKKKKQENQYNIQFIQ